MNDPSALAAFKAYLRTHGAQLTAEGHILMGGTLVATDVDDVRFDGPGVLYSLVVLRRVPFLPAPDELPLLH